MILIFLNLTRKTRQTRKATRERKYMAAEIILIRSQITSKRLKNIFCLSNRKRKKRERRMPIRFPELATQKRQPQKKGFKIRWAGSERIGPTAQKSCWIAIFVGFFGVFFLTQNRKKWNKSLFSRKFLKI